MAASSKSLPIFISLLLTGFFLLYASSASQAQRCATVTYQELLKAKNPSLPGKSEFEQWLKQEIEAKAKRVSLLRGMAIVNIPVVVHIIHNGEEEGVGINVPKAQVLSQIEVLNEDFRRTNPDASETPAIFQPIAADVEINFVLARRDPEGLATDGIVRVDGGRAEWFMKDNYTLKRLSYWPAEDYLNIWVANLEDGFLGYAQFPVSDEEGLEDASHSRLTDGVAIDYKAFGSIDKFPAADLIPNFNKGRTATHEIGHFFGLRHIWGDGSCGQDDFVTDTPPASTDHGGLSPCSYPGPNTCSSESPDVADMFQNYMDYTDDACMNLFTNGQKERMQTILEMSPRRASLVNSAGDEAPVSVANDAGIKEVVVPGDAYCLTQFTPEVVIRNYGTNDITSVAVTLNIDGNEIETITVPLDLIPLEVDTITFSEVDLVNPGSYEVTFTIIQTNGTSDGNTDNDLATTITMIPPSITAPFNENFNTFPTGWSIDNLDNRMTWEHTAAPNGAPANQAMFVEFYSYPDEGEIDLLHSPAIDLTNVNLASLSFDVAYTPFASDDGLIVTVSDVCRPLAQADTVYIKYGDSLKTVSNQSNYFTPSGAGEWRTETIDVSAYTKQYIQLTFISITDFGNNLYLDNVSMSTSSVPDVNLAQVLRPNIVTAHNDADLHLLVKNAGVIPLTSFDLTYNLDGTVSPQQGIALNTPLNAGQSREISIPLPRMADGEHFLEVNLSNPNGDEDPTPDQNEVSYWYMIDNQKETIPIREAFGDQITNWTIGNPENNRTWRFTNLIKGEGVLTIDNANNNTQDWFASPLLDFTQANQATFTFDVAFSNMGVPGDGLYLLVSTDGGASYEGGYYSEFGNTLGTGDFINEPDTADWKTVSLSLNKLLGQDSVRLALVAVSNGTSGIYLDNINVYTTEASNGYRATLYPNPTVDGTFNVIFDLENKQAVTLSIYNTKGHVINTVELPQTVNQTYTFDLSGEPAGIYLLRAIGTSFNFTQRIVKAF